MNLNCIKCQEGGDRFICCGCYRKMIGVAPNEPMIKGSRKGKPVNSTQKASLIKARAKRAKSKVSSKDTL